MTVKDHSDCTDEDCYHCKLMTVAVSPYAMPSRLSGKPASKPDPAWERGIPTDHRGMPMITETGSPLGAKQFAERSHEIKERRRQLANS